MDTHDSRVRLRLQFERRSVLTKQQRSDGLDRCWFLLCPELSTVSDLACDITRAFNLQSTCPDGLLLSMDDFVLPPFESTDIFRDSDLIRVRKNKCSSMEAIQLREDEGDMARIENGEGTVAEQLHLSCSPILAIAQFEKEAGGYLPDEEDDVVDKLEEPNALNSSPVKKATKKKKRKRNDSSPSSSKKRKHKSYDSEHPMSLYEGRQDVAGENDPCCYREENTRNIQGDDKSYHGCDATEAAKDSKLNGIKEYGCFLPENRRKKRKQTNDKAMVVVEDAEATNQEEVSLHNGVHLRGKPNGICKSHDGDDMNLNTGAVSDDVPVGATDTLSMTERKECCEEKIQQTESEPQANGEGKKVPSRSARRKQAKRRWLREVKLGASNVKESQTLDNHKNNARGLGTQDISLIAEGGDVEDTVIPIVVRPGHIRFEHSDEDISDENQELHDKETFHSKSAGTIEWNGTLDKKKGQKWGRMRTSSTWSNEKIFAQHEQSKANVEIETVTQQEDFEKLSHITGSPKVGDVLAYRLVELSSSWCPELSSFRVGQVTAFNPSTMSCTLVPVPGYAILLDKAAEESEMLPEQSAYKSDGSLEIEFTSLVDVRLLDGAKSRETSMTGCRSESTEAAPLNLGNSGSEAWNLNPCEVSTEKKDANGWDSWDEIQQAIEQKKMELQRQNNGASKQENDPPAKPSWSYRALRGSALGPTISLLRANNAL